MRWQQKYWFRLLATVMYSVFFLAACGTPKPSGEDGGQVNTDVSRKDTNSPTPIIAGDENKAITVDTVDLTAAPPPPVANPNSEKGNNIHFSADKRELDQDDRALLGQHATRLKRNRRLVLTLRVHTDNRGSRTYNLARAEQWTKSIRETLRALGIEGRQVRVEFARHRGVTSTCNTATCKQNSQRVELIFKK